MTSLQHECSCLSLTGTGLESHLTITECTSLSQGLEWRSDGVLSLQGKCLRPAVREVVDGTKLILSTSCNPSEVAFRMTSIGAIQHVQSLLCVQFTDWWNGIQLALGREGCYDVKWSWTTILLKGIRPFQLIKCNNYLDLAFWEAQRLTTPLIFRMKNNGSPVLITTIFYNYK